MSSIASLAGILADPRTSSNSTLRDTYYTYSYRFDRVVHDPCPASKDGNPA